MPKTAYIVTLNREDLSEVVASTGATVHQAVSLDQLSEVQLRSKELLLGWWDSSGDPFPDFIAIEDKDYSDTEAWLSAYMPGLTPITQWCRLWRVSELRTLRSAPDRPSLGPQFAAWVGAIIAEFGSQGAHNLRDVSGAAPLTAATYAAGRAIAVWNGFDRFDELLKRHAMLAGRLQGNERSVAAEHLLPLWYVLAGNGWKAKIPTDARALEFARSIVNRVSKAVNVGQDEILQIATSVSNEFSAPEIAACATGTQGNRVQALDRLGERLAGAPRSAATSAIMGFAASLVDPGAPLLPELLRRFSSQFPAASLWAGAFAGIWFPVRVLSEHGGLGRIIGKELLALSDLFTKPSSDISFDELARWTGGTFNKPLATRGLMLRTIFVELVPGVAVPVSTARGDASRSEGQVPTNGKTSQQTFELTSPEDQPADGRKASKASPTRNDLSARLTKLEKLVQDLVGGPRKGRK